MWEQAGPHKQQGLAGCIRHKKPTVEGEARLQRVSLRFNAVLSAPTAGFFLTDQFGADRGSKRMFLCDDTSHSDPVHALFGSGVPPQLENCPSQ